VLGLLTRGDVRKQTYSISGRASTWPSLDFGIVSLSYGWIFSLGIVFLALIGIAAVAHIFYRTVKRDIEPDSTIAGVVVITGVIYGILFSALLSNGGLPTAKRVLAIPAILAATYWALTLEYKSMQYPFSRNQLLSGILICLLITSGLSVPRLLVDGQMNPNDFTADSSDLQRYEWVRSYDSNCITSYHRTDVFATELTQTNLTVKEDSPPRNATSIYDNSDNEYRRLFC
jgi:hypothetical protein